MSLDATIGGTNSNSYVTLAFANSFFENMLLPNAWDSATPDDQSRSLMTATQWLEEYDYIGSVASETQALKWPRFGMTEEVSTGIGFSTVPTLILGKYDETEMPVPLLQATCELAFYLLTLGAAASSVGLTTGASPISSLKIGNSVSVTYTQQQAAATATAVATVDPTGLPIHIARLLRGLRQPVVIA